MTMHVIQKLAHQKCANTRCRNREGDGPFALVQVGPDNAVGGHFSLWLLLCAPCAQALGDVVGDW